MYTEEDDDDLIAHAMALKHKPDISPGAGAVATNNTYTDTNHVSGFKIINQEEVDISRYYLIFRRM